MEEGAAATRPEGLAGFSQVKGARRPQVRVGVGTL